MLGLGEKDEEIKEAMADLRAIGVDILTLGQYLQVQLFFLLICRGKYWDVCFFSSFSSFQHCNIFANYTKDYDFRP
jgi:lipoate synthase